MPQRRKGLASRACPAIMGEADRSAGLISGIDRDYECLLPKER